MEVILDKMNDLNIYNHRDQLFLNRSTIQKKKASVFNKINVKKKSKKVIQNLSKCDGHFSL